ncbi:MAG: carbamate kinase, partial [Acidimicrobiia bacterium]
MLIVAALGGNALVRRGQRPEAEIQRRNIGAAARHIAEIAQQHQLLITHGNGPQIGLLALEAEAYKEVHPYPLDMLGAESQGLLGYILQESLSGLLPNKTIAALLTRVAVDESDPAFSSPKKPIGPVYTKEEGRRVEKERGWKVAPDGLWWRRVVASPEPKTILDLYS